MRGFSPGFQEFLPAGLLPAHPSSPHDSDLPPPFAGAAEHRQEKEQEAAEAEQEQEKEQDSLEVLLAGLSLHFVLLVRVQVNQGVPQTTKHLGKEGSRLEGEGGGRNKEKEGEGRT